MSSLSVTPGAGSALRTSQTPEGHHVPWHLRTVSDSTGQPLNLDICTITYARDGNGRVTSVTATSGSDSWVQTITRNGAGFITASSPWVKQ